MDKPPSQPNSSSWSDLLPRIISSIILVTVATTCFLMGGITFILFAAAFGLLSTYEWIVLTKHEKHHRVLFLILGAIYILGCAYAMIDIRLHHDEGFYIILWVTLAVIAADVGGYFAGKTIGGPKIWQRISPKKTWSGLMGGITLAVIASYILSMYSSWGDPFKLALSAIFITVIALIGDLIESGFKRRFGVKDSGKMLPGHGGLLDRFDGLIPAALLVYCVLQLFGAEAIR